MRSERKPLAARASDAALMKRIATGDRQALALLYQQYARTLRRLAQKLLGPLEAEDVVHDVMFEVWQKAQTYDPTRGPALAWLVVRLHSRALDRSRSARSRRRAELSELDEKIEAERFATEDDPGHRYLHLRVRHACAALPDDDQTLLADIYALGLTGAEVADKLLVPLGTVKSRLNRALRRLRKAGGRLARPARRIAHP